MYLDQIQDILIRTEQLLKHFLQIVQNLEFTYAKFLLWSHRNFDIVNQIL